jgi:hypothetical protein
MLTNRKGSRSQNKNANGGVCTLKVVKETSAKRQDRTLNARVFCPLASIIRCQPSSERRRLCTRRLQLPKRYPCGGTSETITVRIDSERLAARHNGADDTFLKCNAFGIAVTP